MPARAFIDTNVLIYVASDEAAKAERADAVLGQGGVISVQVLNELANVCRRKMGLSWPETREFLALVRGLTTVHPLTVETHETGLAISERYGLSTYDAMVVASALLAGCDTLWSEDMQHGLMLEDRLRIANPFRTTV